MRVTLMSYWRTTTHSIGRSCAKIMRREIGCCLRFFGVSENSSNFKIASMKIVQTRSFFVLRKRDSGFNLSYAFHWFHDCHALICHTFPLCYSYIFPLFSLVTYLARLHFATSSRAQRAQRLCCGEEFDNMTIIEIILKKHVHEA